MNETGVLVARYRRHGLVEDQDRERHVCQFGSRAVRPVVGDRVLWRGEPDGTGVIVESLPRSSELKRIDSRGRPEVVAANLTQLAVVLATRPAPDWLLVDRYLSAGELAKLNTIIVFNKLDLSHTLSAELAAYEALGYETRLTSAHEEIGLAGLAAALRGARSALIGQSGVGKSSLINALAGDALQTVGKLTEKGRHGRHTTTTAVLYRLSGGGELIDSPGVRDYAPYIDDPRDVQFGFREFAERLGQCRFDDCRHLAEPDCAIKAAVAAGEIAGARYHSYKKLVALTESFQPNSP